MTSTELDPIVERLWQLIREDREKDVLELIEQLEDKKRNHTQILRIKSFAHAFGRGGDKNEAYALLRDLATRPDNSSGDLYLAGQYAAEFCDYKDAEIFLSSAIDRSKEEDDPYYRNCSLLLRAFVRLHLRKSSLAKEDLDAVADDEDEIFWSKKLGYISKENLRAHLNSPGSSQTPPAVSCSCRKPREDD